MRRRPVETTLIGLVILALAQVWAFEHFPTQDGPSHVYNAAVLLGLDDPGSPYGSFYERRTEIVPNLLGSLTLTGLGRVLPLAVAEKLLLSLCVLIGSLSFALLARANDDPLPPVALLGPLFASGYPLHMGFYSYSLGAALVPLAWAIAWRHRSSDSLRGPLLVGALALLAWLAHPVAVVMLLLGVAVLTTTARSPRALLRFALASAPAAALTGWYVLRLTSEDEVHWSAGELLEAWITLRGLVAYEGPQRWLAGAIALLLLVAVAHRLLRERPREAIPWALLAVLCGLAYVLAANGNQRHWYLSERLSLFPWLALVPLVRVPGRPGLHLGLAATLTLGMMAAELPHHAAIDADLRDYRSLAPSLRRGATVLSLELVDSRPDRRGAARFRPFLHAVGWLAADRELVDVGNYEAHTDHFRTRLRPGVMLPPPLLVEGAPQRLDLRFFPALDYVVTRDLDTHGAPYRAHLEALFVEVARSGRLVLFERDREAAATVR